MSIEEIIARARHSGSWLAHRQAAGELRVLFSQGKASCRSRARIAFLSSFTIEPLVDYIMVEAAGEGIALETYTADYGQFNQEVLDPASRLYQHNPEITVLAVEYESIAGAGANLITPVAEKTIIHHLISLAEAFKKNNTGILIVNTFINMPRWPLHILSDDSVPMIRQINQKILQIFAEDAQIQVCDLDELAAYYGYSRAMSAEMLHMARIPFSEGFLSLSSRKLISYLRAHLGLIRKCLVLDCDNTLWGGIIGEDGMDGIQLGPDTPGREYLDFQKTILELFGQGVILAINSKNNYDDVMKVIREHPHMLLREQHFAGMQINWDPKPVNMKRLAEEINIGLDSFVFVDDSPAEREMMRQMLPEVLTLEMSANPSLYSGTLRETNVFARAYLTEEDRQRGQIYAAQRQRTELQESVSSLEEFLTSLEMVVSIRLAKDSDIKRAAQLTQRTNQFNLTTRRYTETDISSMLTDDGWRIYVLSLKDKFGDNGTVGLAIIECKEDTWRIDTFLMSCRVIGRQVEDAFVNYILSEAKNCGVRQVKSEYIPTKKNKLVADFWERMNFELKAGDEKTSRRIFGISEFIPVEFTYLVFENSDRNIKD
ncbi:MAG: HAD family hydrolase [Sedimentisphaerales bacterium]|nr:HAD family hydrolase [Sedimentisphaerales bacterium]